MVLGAYGLFAMLTFAMQNLFFPQHPLQVSMMCGMGAAVFLLFLLQRTVLHPLEQLKAQLKALLITQEGEDNLARPFRSFSDEIDRLAIRFSLLQGQLRTAHNEVKQRVADKTSEFLDANRLLKEELEKWQQVENHTQQSYRDLTHMIDTANTPIFELDPAGIITEWNQAASSLTGYSKDEALGKSFVDTFLSPENRSAVQAILESAAKGDNTGNFEAHFCDRNGERKPMLLTVSVRHSLTGDSIGLFCVGQDITGVIADREKLEEQLETRTQELVITNAELTRVASAQEKLLANISHKLCTPLNSILGFTDLLSGEFYGKLNAKQSAYVQQVDKSGRQLLFLITDLIDISRTDSSAITLKATVINPKQLIRTVYTMIINQFIKKNVELIQEIDQDLPNIIADYIRSRQIILNLLLNALKYTSPGGRATLAVARENDFQIRCRISDTGVGICADEQSKIFSDFYQITREECDSSLHIAGSGLAVTRRLVELLGGTIGVESRPGNGTTFWFTLGGSLKSSGKEEMMASAHIPLTGPVSSGRRILVAEDNEANLIMICALLRTRGYKADVARDGKEAVEKAKALNPDLILMDIRMPVMNGIEATRQLRALPQFASTPIIAVTAGVDPWSWKQLLETGCTERLAKPISSSALFVILRRYLSVVPATI